MNPGHVVQLAFERGQKYFEWLDSVHGPLDKPLVETVEKTCGTIWDRKGKRLRCHFVHWFSEPYQIQPEKLKIYAWSVEAIHTATLLHDDVIDKAEIRRAGPTANKIFDNTIPVLSGDYLMSDAIHQLAIKGHPELLKGMCLALKELSQGEVLQYENQFKITDSEETYRVIYKLKTASLLKWAASVGPTLAESSDKTFAIQFAEAYGLLYQFTDDLIDLKGTKTKDSHKDMSEGKLNWAAWKVVQTDPGLKQSLLKEFSELHVSRQAIELVNAAFQHPANQKQLATFLQELKTDCLKLLDQFGNDYLRHLLSTLVEFTSSRVF